MLIIGNNELVFAPFFRTKLPYFQLLLIFRYLFTLFITREISKKYEEIAKYLLY